MAFCTPDEILSGNCCVAGSCSGGLGEWAALSGAALMVSITILAFLYIWASLFRSAQLTLYVKHELYELVVTAILIIFLLGAVGAMSGMKVSSFLPSTLMPVGVGQTTTVYNATSMYYEKLGSDMAGWLNMNYIINMYVDQVASVTPYARPLGVGLVASPMAGLASPIKQLLYNMSVAVSVAFIINYAQLAVYIFSLQAFLKYYLPAGIFFRSFTPTRKIGGTLIGVACAFLFVFPGLTLITYSMFYNASDGPLLSFRSVAENFFGSSGPFQSKFENFYGKNFTEGGSGLINLMTGTFGSIGNIFQNIAGGILLTIMLFPIATISYAFAIGFVIPIFNSIIFIQSAKIMSRSFGEEVDISALTRLI
jgi:hypothetical protein